MKNFEPSYHSMTPQTATTRMTSASAGRPSGLSR